MNASKRAWVAGLLAGLTLLATSATAAPAAFGPGEQTTYRVHYLGVQAATTQLTVGAETRLWGREVWPLLALARTDSFFRLYPVNDRFVSYWEHATQQSVGCELTAEEGRKRRRMRVRMATEDGKAQVFHHEEGEQPREKQVELPTGIMDVASATFALRNRPLAVGQTHAMPIFTGTRQLTMRVTVEGVERLQTALGEREVFKARVDTAFEGKLASKRDLHAYFTTDPAHVLVRIEADLVLGQVVAELTDYKPGRRVELPADGQLTAR